MNNLVVLAILGRAAAQLQIHPPATKPENAVPAPADFVGFEIESVYLDLFDNDFSENMINSLAARMSQPPIIRVGGTSGDHLKFNPNQKRPKVCVGEPCESNLSKYILGPSFFKSYRRFKKARMTIQAPLNNPINTTNTLDFVRHAWSNLDHGKRVAAIALGNEVEFIYPRNPKAYVDAALKLQKDVLRALGLSGNAAKMFEVGNTASGSIVGHTGYEVDDILKAGIDQNGLVSTTAEHWYQIGNAIPWTDHNLQELVMNHTAITHRFRDYTPSLQASQARSIPFIINEDAATLSGRAPINFDGGFAYCLWAVDFSLLAMSRGVARVGSIAARPEIHRSFFTPEAARAPFPASIYIAELIGKGSSSIFEIQTGHHLLSAYAMYDTASHELQRVALLNMNLFNGTAAKDKQRPKEKFKVHVGSGFTTVRVKRLQAKRGAAALGFDWGGPSHNVSWAGEQWSAKVDNGKGHFTTGKVQVESLKVKNGVVHIVVPDSEAVMVLV